VAEQLCKKLKKTNNFFSSSFLAAPYHRPPLGFSPGQPFGKYSLGQEL
jgi:hypothetical protein